MQTAICLNGHVHKVPDHAHLSGPFARERCPTCNGFLYSVNDERLDGGWVMGSILTDGAGVPAVSQHTYLTRL